MAVIWIVALLIRIPEAISHDPAWLLYVADKITSGQTLYQDIYMFNLPMSVWLHVPAIWLSDLIGVQAILIFKSMVFALAALSIWLSYRLLRRTDLPHIGAHLCVITLVFLIGAGFNFGQREHIFVLLVLPYLYLIYCRVNAINIRAGLAVCIGIIAAIGISIKPFFLLLPLFLELFALLRLKAKSFLRPEPYVMGLIFAVYAVFIFIVYPDYLNIIVPYTDEIYKTGFQASLSDIASQSILPSLSLLGFIILASYRGETRKTNDLLWIFSLAIVAGMICFWVQKKGWLYQILPAISFASIGTFYILVCHYHDLKTWLSNSGTQRISALLLLMAGLLHAFYPVSKQNYDANDRWAQFVDGSGAETVLILTTKLSEPFPYIMNEGLEWGSRFPIVWMPVSIEERRNALGHSTPMLDEMEMFNRRVIAEDFDRFRPDLVFVDRRTNKPYFDDVSIDYVEYFSRHPDFAKAWESYELIGSMPEFDIFERRD